MPPAKRKLSHLLKRGRQLAEPLVVNLQANSLTREPLRKARSLKRRVLSTSVRERYRAIMSYAPGFELHVDPAKTFVNEIEINKNCNLNCVTCNTQLSTRPQKNMDLDLFERIVAMATQRGTTEFSLHTIGEPLVNPLLGDYLAILAKHGARTFLSTNALRLAEKLDLLIEHERSIAMLRLSVDGATKETYEKLRRPGKFDDLIRNLDALDAANAGDRYFPVSMNSVVTQDVLSELAYHSDFYSRYVPMDRIHLNLMNGLSPDNTYFFAASLCSSHIVHNRPCGQVDGDGYHVLCDGRVSACCRDYNADLICGDLNSQSWDEIVNSEAAVELRRQHLEDRIPEDSLCASCYQLDPRVTGMFSLFSSTLVQRNLHDWRIPEMQRRYETFLAYFEDKQFPTESELIGLLA